MIEYSALNSRLSPALEQVMAAVDRSFLASVKKNFDSLGINTETLLIIWWTLVAAVALGGTVYCINRFLLHRQNQFVPSGTLIKPEDIINLFELALTQRSKIEISFSRQEGNGTVTHCSLEKVQGTHLEIEISSQVNAGPHWIGRNVNGDFRITPPGHAGQFRFYNFHCEITGVTRIAKDLIRVTLALPTKIRQQQKRIHLRLEPPVEYMIGIAIWPEQLQSNGLRESHYKNWGKPSLIYHAAQKEHMRVANISAGGIRIDISRQAIRDTGMTFDMGDYCILLAEMYDPEQQSKRRLWCLARVQNRFEDFETKKLEVGLKFVGHGSRKDDELIWNKVGPDGIEVLGNWVVKRHLELFRTRSLS